MAKSKIGDLRDILFDALEQLKDGKIDVQKAKAIASVSQTIINSATLEVRAMNAVNAAGNGGIYSDFFDAQQIGPPAKPALPERIIAKPNGGTPPGEGIHAKDPLYAARRAEPRRSA